MKIAITRPVRGKPKFRNGKRVPLIRWLKSKKQSRRSSVATSREAKESQFWGLKIDKARVATKGNWKARISNRKDAEKDSWEGYELLDEEGASNHGAPPLLLNEDMWSASKDNVPSSETMPIPTVLTPTKALSPIQPVAVATGSPSEPSAPSIVIPTADAPVNSEGPSEPSAPYMVTPTYDPGTPDAGIPSAPSTLSENPSGPSAGLPSAPVAVVPSTPSIGGPPTVPSVAVPSAPVSGLPSTPSVAGSPVLPSVTGPSAPTIDTESPGTDIPSAPSAGIETPDTAIPSAPSSGTEIPDTGITSAASTGTEAPDAGLPTTPTIGTEAPALTLQPNNETETPTFTSALPQTSSPTFTPTPKPTPKPTPIIPQPPSQSTTESPSQSTTNSPSLQQTQNLPEGPSTSVGPTSSAKPTSFAQTQSPDTSASNPPTLFGDTSPPSAVSVEPNSTTEPAPSFPTDGAVPTLSPGSTLAPNNGSSPIPTISPDTTGAQPPTVTNICESDENGDYGIQIAQQARLIEYRYQAQVAAETTLFELNNEILPKMEREISDVLIPVLFFNDQGCDPSLSVQARTSNFWGIGDDEEDTGSHQRTNFWTWDYLKEKASLVEVDSGESGLRRNEEGKDDIIHERRLLQRLLQEDTTSAILGLTATPPDQVLSGRLQNACPFPVTEASSSEQQSLICYVIQGALTVFGSGDLSSVDAIVDETLDNAMGNGAFDNGAVDEDLIYARSIPAGTILNVSTDSSEQEPRDDDDGGTPVWAWILIVPGVLGILACIGYLLVQRIKKVNDEGDNDDENEPLAQEEANGNGHNGEGGNNEGEPILK